MKYIFIVICVLFSQVNLAQDIFSEVEAKQIIDTFFKGFHSGDTLMMKNVMIKDVVLQTAYTDTNGKHQLSEGAYKQTINSDCQ